MDRNYIIPQNLTLNDTLNMVDGYNRTYQKTLQEIAVQVISIGCNAFFINIDATGTKYQMIVPFTIGSSETELHLCDDNISPSFVNLAGIDSLSASGTKANYTFNMGTSWRYEYSITMGSVVIDGRTYYRFSSNVSTPKIILVILGYNGTVYLNNNDITISSDPYSTSPDSIPNGGYGDFDYKSDPVSLPTAPTISVSDSGFITLYKPSLGQLQSLAAYMWSGLFDIATFRKIFADPMDCIISLALIPVNPTASGSQELKVGNVGTGITINKLPTQFVEVTFNSLNIGLRANNFMDYSPYTKLQIYLPFIGTRSLSIDDIAGKNVTLKYIIDIFTGACNASIGVEVEDRDGTQKTTCLYQFTGNVLANVPVTANNFASFLQATVGAVSTAVGVATGAGALAGVASAINAAQSMKPDIEKSGNLSATAGFLGVQKPYLILTYPNLCRPVGRDKVTGTPSFLGLSSNKKLSSFHGYTQLHRINVQGITCTETERQMILSQLTGEGVILP